jgi:transposase
VTDRVKLLLWDRNGFWLMYKRLEKGTFPFAAPGAGVRIEIERGQLAMLLEGLEWRNAKKASHYTKRFDIMKRDGTRPRTPA